MPGTKRQWRKELKKQQRKRRRQKSAVARDLLLEEEEAYKQNDPAYQQLLQQQAQIQEEQTRLAEQRHVEEETAWLRRDLLAQREFRRKQEERAAAEAVDAAKRRQQDEALAAKEAEQRRRREERENSIAIATAEFEQMMKCMESFLNNDGQPPPELCRIVESRPAQNLCVLYERTNCCRYGVSCTNNHRRPLLSNTIVMRHFFMHPLLEQQEHKEYATADGGLELSERDLRLAYFEFFEDVVPELEGFGCIRNFRAVRNVARHLRGHVFIEYLEERSALKAFIKLQNRYYAGKQLNVEFSSIKIWRSAICGLSHTRKCPKGEKCQYLHLFKNPRNKYCTPLETNRPSSVRKHLATPLISWTMVAANKEKQNPRNWRWSESPEMEIPFAIAETEKTEIAVSSQDAHSKVSSDTAQGNSTNLQAENGIENVTVNCESKRRRKKHKRERVKAQKNPKRKYSRSSKHIEKRTERKNDIKPSNRQHKTESARSRCSSASAEESEDKRKYKEDNSVCSQKRSYTDDSRESSRSTKRHKDTKKCKDDSSTRNHSTQEEKLTQREHSYESLSSDSSTPKRSKNSRSKRSESRESCERVSSSSNIQHRNSGKICTKP